MSRQFSKACSSEKISYYGIKRMEANYIPSILTENNIHIRPMSPSIDLTYNVDLSY